jgi:hypothetical protein
MAMKPRAKAKPHMFMPGDTVSGAIKKNNFYDVTKEEMNLLLKSFNTINGDKLPRPGMHFMIPILERHQDAAFNPSESH